MPAANEPNIDFHLGTNAFNVNFERNEIAPSDTVVNSAATGSFQDHITQVMNANSVRYALNLSNSGESAGHGDVIQISSSELGHSGRSGDARRAGEIIYDNVDMSNNVHATTTERDHPISSIIYAHPGQWSLAGIFNPGGVLFNPRWGAIPHRLGRKRIGNTDVMINDEGLKDEVMNGVHTIGAAIEFINVQPGETVEPECRYKYFNYVYRDMFYKAFSPPWSSSSTEEGKLRGQIPGAKPGVNFEKARQLDIEPAAKSPTYYPKDKSKAGDCQITSTGGLVCVKTDWPALDLAVFLAGANQAKGKLAGSCNIICVYAIQYFEAWFAKICGENIEVKTVSSVRVDSNRCYDCSTMALVETDWAAPDSDTSEETAVAGKDANFKDEFIRDIKGFGGDWAKKKITFS